MYQKYPKKEACWVNVSIKFSWPESEISLHNPRWSSVQWAPPDLGFAGPELEKQWQPEASNPLKHESK